MFCTRLVPASSKTLSGLAGAPPSLRYVNQIQQDERLGFQIACPWLTALTAREMKNHLLHKLLSLGFFLSGAILPSAARAQAPAQPPAPPVRIDIVVVDGEGVTTNTRQRVARDPVVKVEDDDHRPVDGAVVVFALPVSGASGEFFNGAKNLTVVTGKDGLATARGLRTNEIPGPLQIIVMASYQGLRARGRINQTVEAAPGAPVATPELHASKSGSKWKWILLGVAAVGGAGAAIYFTHHSSSTTNSPISITAGTVVFGNP